MYRFYTAHKKKLSFRSFRQRSCFEQLRAWKRIASRMETNVPFQIESFKFCAHNFTKKVLHHQCLPIFFCDFSRTVLTDCISLFGSSKRMITWVTKQTNNWQTHAQIPRNYQIIIALLLLNLNLTLSARCNPQYP